jgi:Crinkler effector protein N-terminal domain
MSDDFWCLIIGDDKTFPVTIDPAQSVGHLKDAIKKKKEHALGAFDADSLELYQVSVDVADVSTRPKRMDKLTELSQQLNEDMALDEKLQLSVVFDKIAPGKEYYIIVQTPEGE